MKKQFCALGKAIEQCQANEAISTYRLSMMTGITESTLSRLKYGKSSPTLYTMQRIARALNVDLSDLIREMESLPNMEEAATAQRDRAIKAERLLELSEKGYKAEIKKLQDRIEFEGNC